MEKGSDEKMGVIERKAALEARAEELRAQMRDSQLNKFRVEARSRQAPSAAVPGITCLMVLVGTGHPGTAMSQPRTPRLRLKRRRSTGSESVETSEAGSQAGAPGCRMAVLRRLGHIDASGLVLSKGRAACEIDTSDELLTVELMFNGVFSRLDKHKVVALASCLIPLSEVSHVSHPPPARKDDVDFGGRLTHSSAGWRGASDKWQRELPPCRASWLWWQSAEWE